MQLPLLSIVIANYNYGRFLEEAIESVVAQDMGDRVELIICDAESTDNSVEIIKKYACGLPPNTPRSEWIGNTSNIEHKTLKSSLISWWCSEKDAGQSAAFNKGFLHARGRYLTWLNADDVLLPNALKKFEKTMEQNPASEWFVGGVMWLSKEMRIIKCGRGRPFSDIRYKAGIVSVWGPSSIFSRRIYDLVGGVDERFRYTMDTDLWMKFAHLAKVRYLPFADYAWGLRLHENAKMSAHNFAESGQSNVNHPKWKCLDKEAEWRSQIFAPKHSLTFWRQLISIDLMKSMCGRKDTFIYKGKHYKEYFK